MSIKAKVLIMGLAISASAIAFAQKPVTAQPQAIEKVDVQRYMGTWYEIARLPVSFQKKCASDVKAQYSLNSDQTIKVMNTCMTKKGQLDGSEGLATSQNAGNSKLKVTFLPKGLRWLPFTKGDYWVLKIDPEYNHVLVGGSSHDYLWILSRTPSIDDATYQDYLDTAKAQGYDVSKLIKTQQNQK